MVAMEMENLVKFTFLLLTGFVFDRVARVTNVVGFSKVGGPSLIFFYKEYNHLARFHTRIFCRVWLKDTYCINSLCASSQKEFSPRSHAMFRTLLDPLAPSQSTSTSSSVLFSSNWTPTVTPLCGRSETAWCCHRRERAGYYGPPSNRSSHLCLMVPVVITSRICLKTIKILEQVGPESWHGRAGVPATVRGMKAHGTRSARKWKMKSRDVTRVERGEGILDVKSWRRFAPVYQEPTWNEHEAKMIWARLQTGRKTSLCSHLKVDVRRSVRIRRAKWPQGIVLRRKA